MKILGAIIGIVFALAIHKWAPDIALKIIAPSGFGTMLGGVAAILTAPWAVALGRQSVYEKVDDLGEAQRKVVMARASSTRRFIIRSMMANALLIVIAITWFVELPQLVWGLYLALGCMGVWLTGLFQAWKCWSAAEVSRLTIATASATQRARRGYVLKMRDDDRKDPVDRRDHHLNGYVKNH